MSARLRHVVTTLVLVAAGAGVIAVHGGADRPRLAVPPVATEPRPLPPLPATAGEILARADAIGLTAGQRARLETLDRTWRAEAEPLEAAVRAATEEFSRFMAEAQTARRASLADVQQRAADVSRLGHALRERRRAHVTLAAAVLDESQPVRLGATVNNGGER
jgi:hypothetical protein